jgi:DNA invertase Pin-like site-specific DNA recombinase
MSRPKRLAISYSRFSDPRQAEGDSESRQADMFRAFCARHDLIPLAEVFADRGRSGYHDEHRKRGRLGQLIAMARDSRFDPGTVVVVEAWDRLGRLRPDKQTDLIRELLETGLRIGVCRLDEIFCEEDFGTHRWMTLAVFVQLAFQESKQKADRVARSWQNRRERVRAEGGLVTTVLPSWLELGPDGRPRLIPRALSAVRRVFALAAEGHGHARIVKTLEAEKVPALGKVVVRKGRTRSRNSGRWCKPYVASILNDRRALGELQLRLADGTPDGQSIADYYPAAVTPEEFALARAGQAGRVRGKKSPRQRKYVNAFRGLLKHARDGEGFTLHNRGTAASPVLTLINATGEGGRAESWTFPYDLFESGILTHLREVSAADVLPRAETPSHADVLRARLLVAQQDVASLAAELKARYSKALTEVLRAREEEAEKLANELQEELARSLAPAVKLWGEVPALADLVGKSADPDGVRLRLRVVLHRTIDVIAVLLVRRGILRLCAAQAHFQGGATRSYLLGYRPAGNGRVARDWSVSLADVLGDDDFDLRQRADAAELETALLAVDVGALERLADKK